ncbi:hypothetical protein BV25DRAFT_160232 [Artomyces pyxidatus]|uniref:Uncharacterized protein n=1 Tax=Artomyces pyxidatus TaxID=48021 RepID=A0ACB8T9V7_9AGAM|nr:hypothetical protein BV25DRAFT_160232 [Artomyces pyxidatus]
MVSPRGLRSSATKSRCDKVPPRNTQEPRRTVKASSRGVVRPARQVQEAVTVVKSALQYRPWEKNSRDVNYNRKVPYISLRFSDRCLDCSRQYSEILLSKSYQTYTPAKAHTYGNTDRTLLTYDDLQRHQLASSVGGMIKALTSLATAQRYILTSDTSKNRDIGQI